MCVYICVCIYIYIYIYRYTYICIAILFLLKKLCYGKQLTYPSRTVKINYGTYLYIRVPVYSFKIIKKNMETFWQRFAFKYDNKNFKVEKQIEKCKIIITITAEAG